MKLFYITVLWTIDYIQWLCEQAVLCDVPVLVFFCVFEDYAWFGDI